MDNKIDLVEYTFIRNDNSTRIPPKKRVSLAALLGVFQIFFIIAFWYYAQNMDYEHWNKHNDVGKLYGMFMDVHSMMFIGFGFLMTFLKRYGYSSVGYNFLVAAFVLEWALLVRGWIEHGLLNSGTLIISIENLLVADFCSAAVLISFGAVIGKASLTQLLIMALFEVIVQGINEHIGLSYLQAYDVGESMYVHVFGAFFGLAVAKVLHHKEIDSKDESSNYHSDLFSMIGTVFLWLYWPSFNSAVAKDEGQIRAIVNTYLSISASCVTTFLVSTLVGRGRLNMVHVQNATLAGGVAIGAIADMGVQPFAVLIVGSVAGIVSTLGFQYLTDALKGFKLHDTCGVNNLHGVPGVISGIASALVAVSACREDYGGDRLYVFYPARTPVVNSTEYMEFSLSNTEFKAGGLGRSAMEQGGYQLAALGMTLLVAIVSGAFTGLIMKLKLFEQIRESEEMFDDEPNWHVPEGFSLELKGVKGNLESP
jgi:ammonium transporter Rh